MILLKPRGVTQSNKQPTIMYQLDPIKKKIYIYIYSWWIWDHCSLVLKKLVGGLNPFEKYEFVSWDDEIPNWMESHKSHVPNHQPEKRIWWL
jgi:hypothetical protein